MIKYEKYPLYFSKIILNSKKFLVIYLFILCIAGSTKSQTKLDSLEFLKFGITQNRLSSIFDKQINSYNLLNSLRYSTSIDNFSFGLTENFKSSFIKGIENTVRDENQFNFFLINRFNNQFDFGLRVNNSILSDSRKLEINQSSVSSLSLFSRANFFDKKLILIPNFGYTNNKQVGEDDSGPEYGIELAAKRFDLYDFDLDTEMKFKNEDISPRKNYFRLIDLRLTTAFDRTIINNFKFKLAKNRKDFYFPADSLLSNTFNIKNNIQERIETQYIASNKLIFFELLKNLTFESEGKLSFRQINREVRYKIFDTQTPPTFDTQVDELKLEFDASLIYNSEKFKGNLRILFSERDEKNKVIYNEKYNPILFEQRKESEEQKNNISTNGTIAFGGDYFFSNNDRISLNLYQSKLKYDTPSPLNDDDRDEILSIARFEYFRIINPFFSLFINLEGSQSHLVYIFASRSSNNNINRVFRLRTGSEVNSSKIISTNIFEVSANYTTYDYEDINSNLRSFSYRQFTALDSTQLFFSKRINLDFLGYIKISEQGDFNWKLFSEKPKRYLNELFLEPKLVFNVDGYSFAFGLRYFNLSTYNYKEKNRIFDSRYLSYGPVSIISLKIFNSLFIYFQGFYEFVKITNSSDRQQANMNLNVNWNF